MITINRNALATDPCAFPKTNKGNNETAHDDTKANIWWDIAEAEILKSPKLSKFCHVLISLTRRFRKFKTREISSFTKVVFPQEIWSFRNICGDNAKMLPLYEQKYKIKYPSGTLMIYKSSSLSRCFESSTTLTDQGEIISGPKLITDQCLHLSFPKHSKSDKYKYKYCERWIQLCFVSRRLRFDNEVAAIITSRLVYQGGTTSS